MKGERRVPRIAAVAVRGPVYGTPTVRGTHSMELMLANASKRLMLHNDDRGREIHGIAVVGAILTVLTAGVRSRSGDRSRRTVPGGRSRRTR